MPLDPLSLEAMESYVRDKDSFKHAQEIAKPFGSIEPMLAWCKAELQGEWRWQLVELSGSARPGRYIFYFDVEKDYFAFVIKWL